MGSESARHKLTNPKKLGQIRCVKPEPYLSTKIDLDPFREAQPSNDATWTRPGSGSNLDLIRPKIDPMDLSRLDLS